MTGELLVMIEIAGRLAAIPAVDVQSVIELDRIYPVPQAPAHVSGLTAMRSQSLTVIDCHRALQQSGDAVHGERAPVVEIGGHLYALQVDLVDDVISSQSEITPIKGGFGANWQHVAHGMVETDRGPALLLDVAALIAGPQKTRAV